MRVTSSPPVLQIIVEEQRYEVESQDGRIEGSFHGLQPTLEAQKLEARIKSMGPAEVQSPVRVPAIKRCTDGTKTVMHGMSIAAGVAVLPSCAAAAAGPFWLVIPAGLLALSLLCCVAAGTPTWKQRELDEHLAVQARTYDPR